MYIDDDEDDLFIFSETLKKQFPQFRVIQAPSGEEGLKNLAELPEAPVLVILDMNMPKIDGRDVLQTICQNPRWAMIPVVVFTSSPTSADVALGRKLGAGFVAKPMDYESLKETINSLVKFSNQGENGVLK